MAIYEDLKGKAVLITGGADELGSAVAAAFLAQGCKVALVDFAADALAATAAKLAVSEDRLLTLTAEAFTQEAFKVCIDATVRAFGTIDVVFSNTGFMSSVLAVDMESTGTGSGWVGDMQSARKTSSIDLTADGWVTMYVEPIMKTQKSGLIISIDWKNWDSATDDKPLSRPTEAYVELGAAGRPSTDAPTGGFISGALAGPGAARERPAGQVLGEFFMDDPSAPVERVTPYRPGKFIITGLSRFTVDTSQLAAKMQEMPHKKMMQSSVSDAERKNLEERAKELRPEDYKPNGVWYGTIWLSVSSTASKRSHGKRYAEPADIANAAAFLASSAAEFLTASNLVTNDNNLHIPDALIEALKAKADAKGVRTWNHHSGVWWRYALQVLEADVANPDKPKWLV